MPRMISALTALCLLAQALVPPAALAHDFVVAGGVTPGTPGTPQGGQPPTANGSQDHPPVQRATDPVDIFRGDFVLSRQDVLIPGRGLPVAIAFTYRSRSAFNGPYGYGWDMSYHRRIRKLTNNNLLVLRGDNRKDEFVFSAPNAYTAPPGMYDTLVQNGDGTYTLTSKHGDVEQYDANGVLSQLADRNGNAVTFSYDPVGPLPVSGKSAYFVNQATGVVMRDYRLTRITASSGQTIDFAYNADGRLSTITYAGRTITYGYDPNSAGDLVTVTTPSTPDFPSGNTTTYAYSAAHNLTTITDPKGQTYLTNTYDPDATKDRVVAQDYGSGSSRIYYPTPGQDFTLVYDRRSNAIIYRFDAQGHIIEQTQTGRVTRYEYNANGERTRTIFPRGNELLATYDAKGNVLELRRKAAPSAPASDLVTTFTYEPQFNFVKTITDPRGNVTTYTYDYELGEPAKGNLRKITYPSVTAGTPEATFTYNAFGQISQAVDPNTHATSYVYDATTGYLTEIHRDPAGVNAITRLAYDAVGNVTSTTDPNGNATTFEYNALNQLTRAVAATPFGFETRYRYDANGNLAQTDRQATTTLPGALPALGTVSAADNWQSTVYAYTPLDQVASVTDDLNHSTAFAYDAAGNRASVTDAAGHVTTYTYEERNLLQQVHDAASPSGTTTYVYDDNGNVSFLSPASGGGMTYAYDGFDRLQRMTYSDTTFEAYQYDAAGNLTQRTTPAGQTIAYVYDALNRLTQQTTPEETTTYAYDLGSRLTTAADGDASIAHTYDALNRLTQVATDPAGPLAATTVGYQYDAAGLRTRLTYPDSTFVTYSYDQLNRLTAVKTATGATIATFTYDALSRRTSLGLANGLTTSYSYDAASRLLAITQPTVGDRTYTYDPLGNRLTLTDPAGTTAGGYDPLSQVTRLDYPAGFFTADTSYLYDGVGNRLRETVNGTPANYSPNSLNQYRQRETQTFTYDGNGNLTNDQTTIFAYDSENRLLSASANTSSYTYDPFGRRLSKTVGGVTTRFLYDGEQLLAETDAAGAVQAKYVFGAGLDEPLRLERSGTFTYYHADGLGSIVALTDGSGAVLERYQYDAFGQTQITDPAGAVRTNSLVTNRFCFTGRELDAETGLYHYRTRTYSPNLGRFLQRDPVGYAAGVNLYTYVSNNPTNYVDPNGDVAVIAGVAVGIVVTGAISGAILEGAGAYLRGEPVARAALRGGLQGAAGSFAGVLVGVATRSPSLTGAVASLSYELAGQGFDLVTQGKSFSASSLAYQTLIGAALGPLVSRAIPLQGRWPNPLATRSLQELLRPNTQRLIQQTVLGSVLEFLTGLATEVRNLEGAETEQKK